MTNRLEILILPHGVRLTYLWLVHASVLHVQLWPEYVIKETHLEIGFASENILVFFSTILLNCES